MTGLTGAIDNLARQAGRLADAIAPAAEASMAERSTVALWISVENEATTEGNSMSTAIALNNKQRILLRALVPSTADQDGQAIVDPATGQPVDPAALGVSWSTDAPETILLEGLAADGRSGVIGSGVNGAGHAFCDVGPYPDGSHKRLELAIAVGNSAPGEPTLDFAVEDEPAAPAPPPAEPGQ